VQVHDGRAGLGGADRGLGDLLGRHRQVRRHGRRVDGEPVTAQVMMTLRE
jgi:hypothetical protein